MQSSPSTPAFKNLVDSPFCTCGDIEESHHFLFVCHQFTDLRFGSESVHVVLLGSIQDSSVGIDTAIRG